MHTIIEKVPCNNCQGCGCTTCAGFGHWELQKQISISWKYFFGGHGDKSFDRFYKADINGVRVEKHASNGGVFYAIGNISKAKKKYKSETELIKAIMNSS